MKKAQTLAEYAETLESPTEYEAIGFDPEDLQERELEPVARNMFRKHRVTQYEMCLLVNTVERLERKVAELEAK